MPTTYDDSLHDPLELYPKLDIPEQRQNEPGLDRELRPRADHGADSYIGSGRLRGRKALITGGDSGIGRAVAIAFAKEGADVAIQHLPVEQPDVDDLLEILRAENNTAVAIAADFSESSAPHELVEKAVSELGGLDIIVNNAARQVSSDSIRDISLEQLETTFRVNVFSMFEIIKAALTHLPAGASIINTTSIQATHPSTTLLDYAATKAAIENFTKGLSAQMIDRGIRVNAVAPGPIWTPLQPSYGQPMEKLVHFGESSPMKRAGQPAELAGAYVYLASNEASYVNGAILPVTGGQYYS